MPRRVLAGLVPSALGLGLAAVLAACGSGQITQTDTQSASVNGASATVGAMSISDAQLAYPKGGVYQPGSTATLTVTIANNGIAADTLVRVSSPAATAVEIDGSPTGGKAIPGGFAVKSGIDPDDLTGTAVQADPSTIVETPLVRTPSEGPLPSGIVSASGSASADAPPSASASAGAGGAPSASGAADGSASAPSTVQILLSGVRTVNGDSLRPGLTIPITFYFAHAGQVTIAEVPIGAPSDVQQSQAAASSGNG